jgi:hypothetical protein
MYLHMYLYVSQYYSQFLLVQTAWPLHGLDSTGICFEFGGLLSCPRVDGVTPLLVYK